MNSSKNIIRTIVGLFCSLIVFALTDVSAAGDNIAVVPWPQSIRSVNQTMEIAPRIQFKQASLEPLARLLSEKISRVTRLQCEITSSSTKSGINFYTDTNLKSDSYRLAVGDHQVVLKAGSYQGFVYATATLIQLVDSSNGILVVPVTTIEDSADYPYRSVLLDLARFWQPVHTIKETIDLAYLYKLNYLHLHLTDDQSFTFPSTAFPKLKSYFSDGTRRHYTVEELKDIVEYARIRGVTVIPEIDVPGHSRCLVQQMPKVFGTVDPNTGEPKATGAVVNMASEGAYQGLDTLIGELCDVFTTSPYIHTGADEVAPGFLTKLPEFMPYVKKHKLYKAQRGVAGELYAHFVVRMNDIVKKHGKQMIVWEGFHGTGAENARVPTDIIVMSWNNSYNPPQHLLDNGYTIINCTWKPMYIVPPQNYMDSQEFAYAWNIHEFQHRVPHIPYTRVEDGSNIMGAQICYWEQTYEAVFPALRRHIPVVAERIWNLEAGRPFTDFQKRFEQADALAGRLNRPVSIQAEGLLADSKQSVSFDKQVKVTLSSDIPGIIRYRLDDEWGQFPDGDSPVYAKPVTIDRSTVVTAGLFDADNQLIGTYAQQKYSKITPAYQYRVLGPVPKGGWPEVPDFSTLTEMRTGVLGHADAERMRELNRVVFAKMSPHGHLDTQPYRQTNPFALELTGQIEIPKTAQYLFKIRSPFGMAKVYIGDTCVAQYDRKNKGVAIGQLDAGVYLFKVEYFYSMIQNALNVQMKAEDEDKFTGFDQYVLPISEWKNPSELSEILENVTFGKHVEEKYRSLATNRPVTCSGVTQQPHVTENAVDGDPSNRSGWHCGSSPQWLQVDLEAVHTIDRVKLVTYYDGRRHYRYFVEVSTDAENYTEVVDQRGNTLPSSRAGFEHIFDPIRARYVSVTMTNNSANPGVHINEVLVYKARQ